MRSIDIEKFLQILNNKPINIIDVRTNYEYLIDRIPTARNIDKNILKNTPEKYLNKNEVYYIYCQSGHTSKSIVECLNNQGYQTVNISGGYNNYLLRK